MKTMLSVLLVQPQMEVHCVLGSWARGLLSSPALPSAVVVGPAHSPASYFSNPYYFLPATMILQQCPYENSTTCYISLAV